MKTPTPNTVLKELQKHVGELLKSKQVCFCVMCMALHEYDADVLIKNLIHHVASVVSEAMVVNESSLLDAEGNSYSMGQYRGWMNARAEQLRKREELLGDNKDKND